jgi:predicted DNA repair protein MutK
MFLVGGGILVHGLPDLHHGIEHLAGALGWLQPVASGLLGALAGLLAGGVVLAVVQVFGRVRAGFKKA